MKLIAKTIIVTICISLVGICFTMEQSVAKSEAAVKKEDAAKKTGIRLSKKKITLQVGKSKTLKLKGIKTKKARKKGSEKVRWKSSNKKVATVRNGKVTAKRVGRATITAKYKKKKYKCKVVVRAKNDQSKSNQSTNKTKQTADEQKKNDPKRDAAESNQKKKGTQQTTAGEGDNHSGSDNSAADTGQGTSNTDQSGQERKITMYIGNKKVKVKWEDNESVEALKKLAGEQPLTIQMSMYGGFEQVGSLGTSLPRNDVQTTTSAGDIVLYSGNQIVVFYGSNTWSYTKLGRITDQDAAGMEELLGNGDVTITISMENEK